MIKRLIKMLLLIEYHTSKGCSLNVSCETKISVQKESFYILLLQTSGSTVFFQQKTRQYTIKFSQTNESLVIS